MHGDEKEISANSTRNSKMFIEITESNCVHSEISLLLVTTLRTNGRDNLYFLIHIHLIHGNTILTKKHQIVGIFNMKTK